MFRLFLLAILAITTPAFAQSPSGNTWLQWRGPHRDGQFFGPTWPDKIDESQLVEQWRVPLAESYSGPIVSDNIVFTTETLAKKTERVLALDRQTGKELWKLDWEGSLKVPFFAASNGSWIRSTPACDGTTLFVGGIRDLLVAIDVVTGKIRWRIDFAERSGVGVPKFGCVCSPLMDGEFIYMHAGDALHKLKKESGEIVWQSAKGRGGMMGGAFSSPTLATIAGKPMILLQAREALIGIDAETGEQLWSHEVETFRGMNILTPTIYRDSVLTSAYGGQAELIEANDVDKDGEVATTWTNGKLEGYMSSPVIVGDYAYLLLRNQRFTCIDVGTGKEQWRTKKQFGKYWSLVVSGEKILALDERGELYLIRTNPEKFELLDSRKLSDSESWAHLAAAGNQLFVRELRALVAYRWQSL